MATISLSDGDMDELSRRVAVILSKDPRHQQPKRPPRLSQSRRSLSLRFTEEVPLMGLNEAIKSKHVAVKALWIVVFFVCVGATSYFLFRIFEEFLKNPTATKVKMHRQEEYSFPPLVLCVDTWLNAERAFQMGLTKASLDYSLSYLYATIKPWKDKYKTNYTKARTTFERVYTENNFTDLVDYFDHISLNAIYDYEHDKQSDDIEYTCSGCKSRTSLPKIIFDQNMCFVLEMSKIDGKERQAHGFSEFFLRVPDLSLDFAKRKSYWRLYVNPLMTKLTPSVPFLSIEKGHTHMVRITSERYRMINKPTEPCVDVNDPKRQNYSALGCTADCVARMVKVGWRCRVLNLDTNYRRPLNAYCNSQEISERAPVLHDSKTTKQIEQEKEECLDSCIAHCDSWKFDTMIDAHSSTQLRQSAISDNFSEKNITAAKIYFTNADVLADGVLVFTEVYTYSLETLIGNIGGTCGIWIGVNILTVVQLFSFCSKYCVHPKAKRIKAVKKPKLRNVSADEQAE